jgi:MFS family permease
VLISLGAACLGGGFLIMGLAPSLVVAAVGSVIGGTGNGVHAVAARTALQEHVRPQWMALVMSLNESVYQAIPGVGILLGGGAAQLDGPRVAFVVAGAGSLVIAGVVAVLLRPSAGFIGVGAPDATPVGPLTFAAQERSEFQA